MRYLLLMAANPHAQDGVQSARDRQPVPCLLRLPAPSAIAPLLFVA
jgi:hypothetical protein